MRISCGELLQLKLVTQAPHQHESKEFIHTFLKKNYHKIIKHPLAVYQGNPLSNPNK